MKPVAAILTMMLAARGGEVIDRVAVSVGQQVVTLRMIERQLRLQSLATGERVADTEEARRAAASRLIDQAIVLREIELVKYTPPTMAEAEQALDRYLKQTGRTRERFVKEIEALGFAEDEFKREMQWRLNVSRFIEYRFAMGVQVSEEEIAAYYKNEYTPQYRKLNPGAAVPPLEEVRQGMTRVVTTRKTNASMEQWLKQMRETLRVRWFDEAFKAAGGAR